jgi:hypothetical protein
MACLTERGDWFSAPMTTTPALVPGGQTRMSPRPRARGTAGHDRYSSRER